MTRRNVLYSFIGLLLWCSAGTVLAIPTVTVHSMPSGNNQPLTPAVAVSGHDVFLFGIVYGVVIRDTTGTVIVESYQHLDPLNWSNNEPETPRGDTVTYSVTEDLDYKATYNIEVYARNADEGAFSLVATAQFQTIEADNVSSVTGNNQSRQVLTVLPVPLTVRILNDDGTTANNDTVVTFSLVSQPEGAAGAFFLESLSQTAQVTVAADGRASVRLSLGSRSGTYLAVAGIAGGNSTATFSIQGLPLGAYRMQKNSGDNQSGIVNNLLGQPCNVLVLDQYGNPVPNVPVSVYFQEPAPNTFVMAVNGPENPLVSDQQGIVDVRVRTGIVKGNYALVVTKNGLVGSPLSFSFYAESSVVDRVTIVSGNIQPYCRTVQPLPVPLRVRVIDLYGNPIRNQLLTYSFTQSPEGSTGMTFTPSTPCYTDEQGYAQRTVVIGSRPGNYGIRFRAYNTSKLADFSFTATMSYVIGSPVIAFPQPGHLTANSTVTLRGTVSSYVSSIMVNGDSNVLRSGLNWEKTVSLQEGSNLFNCRVFDQYGNEGSARSITVYRDSTAPVQPTVLVNDRAMEEGARYLIGRQGIVIAGVAEVGTAVDVYKGTIGATFFLNSGEPSEKIASTVVTSNQGYNFTISADLFAAGDNPVYVVCSDAAQNFSYKNVVLVRSLDAPTMQNVKINGLLANNSEQVSRRLTIDADIFAANIVHQVTVRFVNKTGAVTIREIDVTPHYSSANHHLCYTDTQDLQSSGRYDVVVLARDLIGNVTTLTIADLTVESYAADTLFIDGKVLAYPNPFAPSEGVYMQYVLSEAASVVVKIYNAEMEIIKTMTFDEGSSGGRGGINRIYWDGNDDFNNRVTVGGYIAFVFDRQKNLLGKVKLVALR